MIQEPAIAGRWLELLTEIAPRITRAAAMVNPETSPGGGSYFVAEFETAARTLKVAPAIAAVHSEADIETVILGLGREPGGGLVVTPSVFTINHRASIIALALRHNVPAVYGTLSTSRMAASCRMDRTSAISFAAAPPMSIGFSVAPSRRNFQFNCRSSSKWR
jgi:hypothetical protein